MPDLTTSNVVINRSWEQTLSNQLILKTKQVKMTLATHGDKTSGQKIPASAFGLASIEECSPLTKSDNTSILYAGPTQDKSTLLLRAAATNSVATATGDYYALVKGY